MQQAALSLRQHITIMAKTITVSQLNRYIGRILSTDALLMNVAVSGELSRITRNQSGHWYFDLKDSTSRIRCFLAASRVPRLRFEIDEGMEVVVYGNISVYEAGGSYSVNVIDIQPVGEGALAAAFEKLNRKLQDEGLFDEAHKRPIPRFPKKIGVVTSPTGAAVRDIITTVRRRFPYVDILLYPAKVQGEGSAETVCAGIEYFNEAHPDTDVLIIGRGGGSLEELWTFNEESVARAVYASKIPVISAVGHETDFTICDFVSDLRAPTPSAAAELAVPDSADLNAVIDSALYKVRSSLYNRMTLLRQQYDRSSKLIEAYSPFEEVNKQRKFIDALSDRAKYLAESCLSTAQAVAGELIAKAQALDPLAVLNRGFSYVVKDDHPAVSVNDVKSGDMVDIIFKDGRVKGEIK